MNPTEARKSSLDSGLASETSEPLKPQIADSRSYRQAVKATSITGASSLIILALRLLKTKVIAVLLGPSGIGLFALLTSVTAVVSSIAGLGINSSGVRQVAEAAADDDVTRIQKVISTLRWTSLVLGCLGAVFLLAFCRQLSVLSVGSAEHAGTLALLAVTILFGTINAGQTALLRGLRRVADLAKLNIMGAFWGTLLAIPFVYHWGLQGIAPAMVTASAIALLASWWYARRIQIPRVHLSLNDFRVQLSGLLGLGVVFLATGVMGSAVQYGQRAMLAWTMDLESVGQFQAAASLSMVYVNFILQAMSLDYYPRLTGVANDNEACNRLVNEQAEISLLLAGPGIIATVVYSPLVVQLLYSSGFTEAGEILRWQCLGVLLRVASWPIGFVLLAKGRARSFLWTETAGHLFYMVCFWILTQYIGLTGAGIAFVLLYLFYFPLILLVMRRVSDYKWTGNARFILLVMGTGYALAMLAAMYLPPVWSFTCGTLVIGFVGLYSLKEMNRRIDLPMTQYMKTSLQKFFVRFPFIFRSNKA